MSRWLLVFLLTALTHFAIADKSAALEEWIVGRGALSWTDAAGSTMQSLEEIDGWLQPIDMTGQNLAREALSRGGWVAGSHFSEDDLERGINGIQGAGWGVRPIGRTLWTRNFIQTRDKQGNLETTDQFQDITIIIDLGGRFGVDSLSFYPRAQHLGDNETVRAESWFIRAYQIFTNEGLELFSPPPRTAFGAWTSWLPFVQDWKRVAQDEEVDQEKRRVELAIPLEKVRYIALNDFIGQPDPEGWEIDEFEVWGRGYALTAIYFSDVVDLGGLYNLGSLKWSVEADPGAGVTIFTSTGKTNEPFLYYERTGLGLTGETQVTRAHYLRLRDNQRGTVELDAENWDDISAPYPPSGNEPIAALGPRRALQFAILFDSSSPFARARLDFMTIEYSTLLPAREVLGEMAPREISPGQLNSFEYALLAVLGSESTGFDAIRVSTPAAVEQSSIANLRIDETPVPFTSAMDEDGFTLLFEQNRVQQPARGVDSVRVAFNFDARVFLHGTRFEGVVFDSQTGEIPQDIVPGDATMDLDTSDLDTGWSLGGNLIAALDLSTPVVTPNGDGLNDAVRISYSLLQVTAQARITLSVYDLSGALIFARIESQELGYHELEWNGTDNQGGLVSPGMYIYRLEIDLDSGSQQRMGTIGVAY